MPTAPMNRRAADDADLRQTMAAASVLPKLVGQRVKRREDPRLIQVAISANVNTDSGERERRFRRR